MQNLTELSKQTSTRKVSPKRLLSVALAVVLYSRRAGSCSARCNLAVLGLELFKQFHFLRAVLVLIPLCVRVRVRVCECECMCRRVYTCACVFMAWHACMCVNADIHTVKCLHMCIYECTHQPVRLAGLRVCADKEVLALGG